jgi:predicted tellurium resistance membrane protein TerC
MFSKLLNKKLLNPKKQPSFIGGVYAVLIADVTLSFDNVLGVAAASREHTYLLIFGLLLSVFLIATAATFFAEYIKKHRWVGIIGLIVILLVALQLIGGGIESQYPGTIPEPFKSWL